jgi:GNAT superfamily N-acetyltransferase
MKPSRRHGVWRRFRRKVRNEGLAHTTLVILNSIVPRPLIGLRVWVVSSADFSAVIDGEGPDCGVRWNVGTDGDDAAIADKLARGELTATIERDGRLVGWDMFATGAIVKEDWLWFICRDREVYGSRSFVEPDYRGQGLAVRLAQFAHRELARHGYHRDYSVIDALNRNALAVAAKVRHLPIGQIAYLRCGRLTIIRIGRRVRAGFWSATNPLVIDFSVFDNP